MQRTQRPFRTTWAIAAWLLGAALVARPAWAQPPMPPGYEAELPAQPPSDDLPPELPPELMDGPPSGETLPPPRPMPRPESDGASAAEFGPAPRSNGFSRTAPGSEFGEGEIIYEGPGSEGPWIEGDDYWLDSDPLAGPCDEPVCGGFPFMWDAEARWAFQADLMILQRQRPRNVLISFDGSVVDGNDLMTTKDIAFNIEPGVRFTAKRFLGTDLANRDYLLEVSYFGLHDWDETAQVTGLPVDVGGGFLVGSLLSPFDVNIGGFNRAVLHRIEYASQLDNLEANIRILSRPRRQRMVYRPSRGWMVEPSDGINLSMLGGFRLMVIDERFEFDSVGFVSQNGTSVGTLGGNYDIDTRNRLFGVQIGLTIDSQSPRFAWNVTGRLGPYYNFLRQQQDIVFNDAADPFATDVPNFGRRDSDERVAFAGQLTVEGRFRVFEHVNLRAAYDFLWVQGLALAPEQLDFALAASPTNRNGKILYQGLSLGAEFVW